MYSKDKKGFETSVTVNEYRGKYRFSFSRSLSRQYWGKNEQVRRTLNLIYCKANHGKAEQIAWLIHHDVLANNFDSSKLWKYELEEKPQSDAQLKLIDGGKKIEMPLIDLYDIYCESRKGSIAETTLKIRLQDQFRKIIVKAIDAVGENALAIREWLVTHYSIHLAKECIRNLNKACQLGVKHKYRIDNPFDGMTEEIKITKGNKKNQDNFDDNDETEDNRAFTIDEMNAIIEAFESSHYRKHLAPIIKFLFWTGCRTGEAIAFKWRDIKWDNETIVFKRSYNERLRKFKGTKTGVCRMFPLPKDGQLWNLLKSLPQGEPDDVVFKPKKVKIIHYKSLWQIWSGNPSTGNPGVIPTLVKEGKVKQYLKLYATRHTFISHQVNIYKIPITTVAQWVGNAAMVSNKNYLDRDRLTVPGYSNQSTETLPVKDENSNPPDSAMSEFLASLTPDQFERFKSLFNT